MSAPRASSIAAASLGYGRHPSNGRASEPASHSARSSGKATVAVAAIHPPATARSSAIAVQEVVKPEYDQDGTRLQAVQVLAPIRRSDTRPPASPPAARCEWPRRRAADERDELAACNQTM
jgi:hypothetical protein